MKGCPELGQRIRNVPFRPLGEQVLSRLANIRSVVHVHVYFPRHSNGLKDIAGYPVRGEVKEGSSSPAPQPVGWAGVAAAGP